MIRIHSMVTHGVTALVCLLLASCGGEGDEAGNGGSTGTLLLNTSALSFIANSATIGATPSPQQVGATVSGIPDGSNVYVRVIVTGNAVARVDNFQITGDNSGSGSVVPADPASLGPGIHTSTITVTACTTSIACTSGIIGQPVTVNVSYNVRGIASTPAWPQITVTDQSAAPADYTTTVTIRSGTPWTVTTSNPLVTVSPASSSAQSTQVTFSINPAAVDQLQVPNGVTQVNAFFNNASDSAIIRVDINNNRTHVLAAMPRVEPAGQAGQVLLSGNNLTLTSIGQIRFGATPASSFAPDSPQVMRATHPALPPGTYPIAFTDLSGTVVPRSWASVVMVNPLSAAASALAYPADGRTRSVTELHYDAERSALVLIVQYPPLSGGGEAATEVLRYTYNGSWSAPIVRSMSYLSSVALRNDGAGWLAARLTSSGTANTIQTCSADFSTCTDELSFTGPAIRWKQIAMTNDNQPLVVSVPWSDATAAGSLFRYSIADRTISLLGSGAMRDGVMAVSQDGQRAILGSSATNSGSPLQANAITTRATSTSPFPSVSAVVTRLAMGRSSALALMNGRRVLDTSTLVELGSLPTTTLGGLLNDAATRAYTFDANGTIRTFDLSVAPVGGAYPEVGTGILPAGDPGAGTNGVNLRMTLSHDGRTLFLAGSARVVVQPLP